MEKNFYVPQWMKDVLEGSNYNYSNKRIKKLEAEVLYEREVFKQELDKFNVGDFLECYNILVNVQKVLYTQYNEIHELIATNGYNKTKEMLKDAFVNYLFRDYISCFYCVHHDIFKKKYPGEFETFLEELEKNCGTEEQEVS